DDTVSDVAADVHTVAAAGGITRDVTSCHRTINVNTRSVTGGIARDSAVAAAGQVAGDIHTTTVSTVTVHGDVGQGAVAAAVPAGGPIRDDTVSDVAADVHTVTVA